MCCRVDNSTLPPDSWYTPYVPGDNLTETRPSYRCSQIGGKPVHHKLFNTVFNPISTQVSISPFLRPQF